jgi:hypothetical protein
VESIVRYALVTAVAVQGQAARRVMRGVRIDLRHEGSKPPCDQKYAEWSVMCDREQAAGFIEEDGLDSFRVAVLSGHAEVHPGQPYGVSSIRSSVYGTGILIAGYCLYGPTLNDFADLPARSAVMLRNAPG